MYQSPRCPCLLLCRHTFSKVSDLNFASPATVSRCGMVYMETSKLGWRPLMQSFLAALPEAYQPDQKTLLTDLFEWLVPACLKTLQQ